MSFEYIDRDGATLKVSAFHGSRVGEQVYVYAGRDGAYVKPEDAPAVALAILEAAGISGGDISNTYLSATWNALDQYVKRTERERREQAEREAEDAKVAEFRKASDPGNHFEWHELKPEAHDAWRKRYRAARKFFEES